MDTNPFAKTLSDIIQLAGIKNSTLAQEVRYDLSYISKWVNGKAIPSERNIDAIITMTSNCVCQNGNRDLLCGKFGCNDDELGDRIIGSLHQAYQESKPKAEVQSISAFGPLKAVVNSIDRMIWESKQSFLVADLLKLPHDVRLLLAGIKDGIFHVGESDLEYVAVINLESEEYIYDTIFLIHMMTSLSGINFQLYDSSEAIGKLLCVSDDLAIGAMLLNQECVSVAHMTDGLTLLRDKIGALVSHDHLIFTKSTVNEMIENRSYIQTLISTNVKWLLGHITEVFLPEDVFEEILQREIIKDQEKYRRIYYLSQQVMLQEKIGIIIYESAISGLVASGELDFYDNKVILTPRQIYQVISNLHEMIEKNETMSVKLLDGNLSSDFMYITNPCVFLSDTVRYLRLENGRYRDNILLVNSRNAKDLFDRFYETLWNSELEIVISERDVIISRLLHYMDTAALLIV